MKVFLSWSGDRSKFIAETLHEWLPNVIQAIEPWMSKQDIKSGGRWSPEIMLQLESSRVGIVCLTPENQNNPWIMFESGALSKTVAQTFVCPLLFEMAPSNIIGPLSQFQANQLNRDGVFRIVQTLNSALEGQALKLDKLQETFTVWWPKLEDKMKGCPPYSGNKTPSRSTDDLLNEVVDNTREQLRREELRLIRGKEMDAKIGQLINVFKALVPFVEVTGLDGQVINVAESVTEMQQIDENYTEQLLTKPKKKKQSKKKL